MATQATKPREIELENGETILVKQIVISDLRRAMDAFRAIDERESDKKDEDGEAIMLPAEEPLKVYLDTLAVCVEKQTKGFIDGKQWTSATKTTPSKEYLSFLEDNFAMDAIETTLLVAAGIDLGKMKEFQDRMREAALERMERLGEN